MTSSHFERPETSTVAPAEKFKESMTNKVRLDLQKILERKVQEFYEERVPVSELERDAQRIFDAILGGADEEQVRIEIAKSAEALTGRIL